MQLVVVMAVRKAVSAATITFTAISMKRFFITLLNLRILFFSKDFLSKEYRRLGVFASLAKLSFSP